MHACLRLPSSPAALEARGREDSGPRTALVTAERAQRVRLRCAHGRRRRGECTPLESVSVRVHPCLSASASVSVSVLCRDRKTGQRLRAPREGPGLLHVAAPVPWLTLWGTRTPPHGAPPSRTPIPSRTLVSRPPSLAPHPGASVAQRGPLGEGTAGHLRAAPVAAAAPRASHSPMEGFLQNTPFPTAHGGNTGWRGPGRAQVGPGRPRHPQRPRAAAGVLRASNPKTPASFTLGGGSGPLALLLFKGQLCSHCVTDGKEKDGRL